jgi:futalosine hydrolase
LSRPSYGGVAIDDFVLVCASQVEKVSIEGVSVHALGIGKTAAAMRLPAVLRAVPDAKAVLLYGIAGAFPVRHRKTPPPVARAGVCVVGDDRFGDEGVETPQGFQSIEEVLPPSRIRMPSGAQWPAPGSGAFPANPRIAADAAARLGAPIVRGATVSTCSGTDATSKRMHERTHADVETMEGAAVAYVCRQLELPLLHVRAISNWTGDRDRGEWGLGAAVDALQTALRKLFAAH